MAKPDGRIEKGQRLASAISARAWNRAQDAADIVLGVRPGIGAESPSPARYAIVGGMELDLSLHTDGDYPLGTAFEITDWRHPSTAGQSQNEAILLHLVGRVAEPELLNTPETAATIFPKPFAVSVEPISQGATTVRVAVSGLVIARVRRISSMHRFVSLPVDRNGLNVTANGVLETSDVGYARLIGLPSGTAPQYALIVL
jgi:hypothetical protein